MKKRKRIIKSVSAVFCALMIMLLFVNSVPCFAYSVVDGSSAEDGSYAYEQSWTLSGVNANTGNEFVNSVITKSDNEVVAYYCFTQCMGKGDFLGIPYGCYAYYFSKSPIYVSGCFAKNFVLTLDDDNIYYCSVARVVNTYVVNPSCENAHVIIDNVNNAEDSPACNINVNYFVDNGYSFLPKSDDVYSSDLGYLQNLTTRSTWLTDSKGIADMNTTRTSVKFDSISTSGVDLTSGDYVIRVYGQRAYFKNNFNDGLKDSYNGDFIFDSDFPLVYFGEFDALSCNFVYDDDDLYSCVNASDDERYSGWDIFINNIHQGCIRYYQIYNKSTGEYGGYVRVIHEGKNIQTTVKDDLTIDDGGFVNKEHDYSIGSGTTYDDAELNADKYKDLVNNGGMQGLESAINSFTSTLGVVPQAIGSVFSFLPSWCHDYIGVCFALLVALVVWKLLRG